MIKQRPEPTPPGILYQTPRPEPSDPGELAQKTEGQKDYTCLITFLLVCGGVALSAFVVLVILN